MQRIFIYIQILLITIFWGLSFVASTILIKLTSSLDTLAIRWTLAFFFMFIVFIITKRKITFKGKKIKPLLLLCLVEPCLYGIFEILGLKYSSASIASVIISSVPIFVAILSFVFLKNKTTLATIIAIIICFIGVIVTVVSEDSFSISSNGIGYLFLFLAAIFGASYAVISNYISKDFTPYEITFIMSFFGFIFFNIVAFIFNGRFTDFSLVFTNFDIFSSSIFLGLFCSVLSFLIFNNVLSRINPQVVSVIIINLTTIVGVLGGVIINGDSINIYKIIGIAITMLGVTSAGILDIINKRRIKKV